MTHHDDDHPQDHAGRWRGALPSTLRPHSHDPADLVDPALESSTEGIRALKISLVVLMLTAAVQLVLVMLTGSVALLADTVHNFSDALTAVPLWIAFVLVRRPATRRHTYGLGRAEDLAGLFIVLMIALSALAAGYESVRRLVDPQPISNPWIVLAAGVIGFAGNELVAFYRIRVGRRIGSAALVADGLHARTDGFTSLAVAAGAIGVLAGFPLADPAVGILITVVILVVLKSAVVQVFGRLLDGVDPDLVDAAEQVLMRTEGVTGVDTVQLRWIGHHLHAETVVTVPPGKSLAAAEKIGRRAEDEMRASVARLHRASVHVRSETPTRSQG